METVANIVGSLIWCMNIIAFSHIFAQSEKGTIWRHISVAFILLGMAVLSI